MHYEDDSVINNQCLQLVVYTMTEAGTSIYETLVTQVLRAHHVHPKMLGKILANFDTFFGHRFEDLEMESFFIVDFILEPKSTFMYEINKIEKVSDYEARHSIMGLH